MQSGAMIGGRSFQLAEVAAPKDVFQQILTRIRGLRPVPV